MIINKDVITILEENGISINNGIPFLLGLHFGYIQNDISEELRLQLDSSNIYDENYKFKVSLFEEKNNDPFDWVKTEYIKLFKDATVNVQKTHSGPASIARMKKLFAENPHIRKDDVIKATELYLSNTNPQYIMYSHYFIEKGSGTNRTQAILEWIEKVQEMETNTQNRTSLTNKLQ